MKPWRAGLKEAGIKDFGHRREMKDDAARAVVEDYICPVSELEPDELEEFVGLVRELMDTEAPPGNQAMPGLGWLENTAKSPRGFGGATLRVVR